MELRKFGSYKTDSGLVVTILKRYSITNQKTGEVTDHCFFFYPDAIGVKTKDAITCREENLKDIIVEEVNDEKYAIKAIFNDCDMQKIMDSGQCFRISKIAPCKYLVVSMDKACICTQVGKNVLVNCKDEDTDYWVKYFRQDVENPQLMGIYNKGYFNPYIHQAMEFSKGMRLLNQDPYECLISFIISQRKSIPAIRSSIEKLCRAYGVRKEFLGVEYFSFPTPTDLCNGYPYSDCGLGYRDEYVRDTAEFCVNKNLKEIAKSKSELEMRDYLKTLRGVGDKVANCTLLYSMGYMDSFPVDVWMYRIIQREFPDNLPEILQYYSPNCGVLQLCLFYYERYKNKEA